MKKTSDHSQGQPVARSLKTVKIPTFFHEILGSEQRLIELILVFAFVAVSTAFMALTQGPYLATLNWLQKVVLWLLFIDISGGVVANLSWGTDGHYAKSKAARWIFIAVHIQPLVLALVLKLHWPTLISIWVYTLVCASLVNALQTRPYQKLLAGVLMAFGIIGLFTYASILPTFTAIILALFMIKVIFSFAVHWGA